MQLNFRKGTRERISWKVGEGERMGVVTMTKWSLPFEDDNKRKKVVSILREK